MQAWKSGNRLLLLVCQAARKAPRLERMMIIAKSTSAVAALAATLVATNQVKARLQGWDMGMGGVE